MEEPGRDGHDVLEGEFKGSEEGMWGWTHYVQLKARSGDDLTLFTAPVARPRVGGFWGMGLPALMGHRPLHLLE